MGVWTVDTWRVRPEREHHFLQHCPRLDERPLTIYRDLEEAGLFWSPARWESYDALQRWRGGEAYAEAIASLEEDVIEHATHVMEDVPGFGPTG